MFLKSKKRVKKTDLDPPPLCKKGYTFFKAFLNCPYMIVKRKYFFQIFRGCGDQNKSGNFPTLFILNPSL